MKRIYKIEDIKLGELYKITWDYKEREIVIIVKPIRFRQFRASSEFTCQIILSNDLFWTVGSEYTYPLEETDFTEKDYNNDDYYIIEEIEFNNE